jgi:hydrogenase maturation protease
MTRRSRVGSVVVIGVGNRYRCDDGAGPAVLDALAATTVPQARLVELDGEPARLVEAWTGADLAIVVDALRSDHAVVGTVRRVEVGEDAGVLGNSSNAAAGSHALGVGTAAALGRALGRMPARLVVFAVEGANFGHGEELSQPVARAVADVATRIAVEIAGCG